MKALYTLIALLPFTAFAQTTWTVHVGGSTQGGTAPYYAPQHLTIDVGDIVHWVRDNGTHNVNGSTSIFPGNPEGFSSGTPNSTVWPFDYTFTIAGFYNYHCTSNGHSATQFGTITVLNPNGIEQVQGADAIKLFPVPSSATLIVDLAGTDVRTAEVLSLEGRLLKRDAVNGAARIELNVASLAAGAYILRLRGTNGGAITRPFTKE